MGTENASSGIHWLVSLGLTEFTVLLHLVKLREYQGYPAGAFAGRMIAVILIAGFRLMLENVRV